MKKDHSSPTIICYKCFFVRYKYLFVCWGGPPSTRQIPETWKIRSVSLTRFDCTLCGTWVGHWPFQTEKNWSSAKHGNSEISIWQRSKIFLLRTVLAQWDWELFGLKNSWLVLATLWFWGFFKGSTLSSLLQGLIGWKSRHFTISVRLEPKKHVGRKAPFERIGDSVPQQEGFALSLSLCVFVPLKKQVHSMGTLDIS